MPTSSTSSPSAPPGCILLAVNSYPGQRMNLTTASTTTRNHDKIVVTLVPARPPLPSNLYIHCPDLTLTVRPRVIRAVEDLFLLRVAFDDGCSPEDSDYFVYRAGNERPASLERLYRPHPFFQDEDVGLLRREHGNYTVAALIATGTPAYDLHIFHSASPGQWISRKVSVTEPQRRYPVVIPENCKRLLYHETSTVISIGGEAGTMGWVDLWRSILLCDVLRDEPTLREMPMPVPIEMVGCDNGRGIQLGCPTPFRGIAFVKGDGGDNPDDCLKLVHLVANATLAPGNNYYGIETLDFQMNDWKLITYTNTAMSTSFTDWRRDCWMEASDIAVGTQLQSELLQSGLLGSAGSGRALHNILVSHPAPDISAAAHEGVVYLMARKKYQHPDVWVLAVDTRNKTLIGAADFGTQPQLSLASSVMYCSSGIAKYIKPEPLIVRHRKMLFFKADKKDITYEELPDW